MRSEDLARLRRESFDVAAARAVAHACILAEYLSPLASIGGLIMAFKGTGVSDEIDLPSSKWKILGLSKPQKRPYSVAGKERCIVIWRKSWECPKLYPRKPGDAAKKPWWL
jgi:16S rRNA (guanine527-N7)-methyltransferase